MPARRAVLLPLVLLSLTALVTACGSAPPEVTFTAAGASATVGPAQYCDIELTGCTDEAAAVATLPVPAGTPLQITVPGEIGESPWQVVYTYATPAGVRQDRTPVFGPGERFDHMLQVPGAGRLQVAEVQQYGIPALVGGEPTFRIRATWVLTAQP